MGGKQREVLIVYVWSGQSVADPHMVWTESYLIGADELQATFQVGTGLHRSVRPDQANAPGSYLLYDLP
jgi:hypothetical protein